MYQQYFGSKVCGYEKIRTGEKDKENLKFYLIFYENSMHNELAR